MSAAGCVLDPVACVAGGVAQNVAGNVANSIITSWANDFAHAEAQMLSVLMAAWVSVPTPDLSSSASTVQFLQTSLQYFVGAVGVVSLMIAAGRMMWSLRVDPVKEALAGVGRLVVVSGAGLAGITLLSQAGDAFSTWILDQASGGDPGATMSTMGAMTVEAFTASSLVIVLCLFAILGFLVQLLLLIVRSALLVVLAGVWPLSAAASMTPTGNQWFKKNVSWILAFLLFKPVAAIIYAAAIEAYTSSSDAMGVIVGIVLLVLATLTLPALMRFVVPMVSAVGNISTVTAANAAIGAATGAVAIVATGGAAAPLVATGLGSSASSIGKSATAGDGGGGGVAGGAGPSPPAPPPPAGTNPGSAEGVAGSVPEGAAPASSGAGTAPGRANGVANGRVD